ncbi:hypothetical protein [Streptomyces rhizosphaericus]|uniref:Uncharacterized protein n=1 Tax=Streptomyces rhizosphaericus TaxID=114699 RepID=A0A6G4ATA4_9ACTN|nr:hypothetical protein [Streptomyces rhizosphaericus]NEW76492.1 hypothetical protein [Streptomyces rhizosphaericus]
MVLSSAAADLPQEFTHTRRAELLNTLGRTESFGVEDICDRRGLLPGLGQFPGPVCQAGKVAELVQPSDRADDLAVAPVAAGPGDPDRDAFTVPDDGHVDLLDQVPYQLFAVRIGCRRSPPDGRQVLGQGADLLALLGGQDARPGGGEAVVLLAQLLALAQRLFPAALQLAYDQTVSGSASWYWRRARPTA